MADSEAQQTADSATQQPANTAQQTVDPTQQVTLKVPVIKQKNPRRVAAGKAIAEKTRLAREAQKKKGSRGRSDNYTKQCEKSSRGCCVS